MGYYWSCKTLTQSDLDRKIVELEGFKRWALLEEIMWRQKFREIWLKEGDRNTKFFHKMTNSHRKHNEMIGLKIDGVCHKEGQDLQQGIVNAFQSLLIDPRDWRANVEGLTFSKLEDQEAARLEKPFMEEEVFISLHELNGEKATGPNGFTVAFWQFNWETVKGEVMTTFKDFFISGKFVKSLNSTFVVMVPKKEGADDFKDLRPISLMGSLYKLIEKVLANRLKKVMNQLVNKAQNAFVEGKQILDASLIAIEVIDSLTRRKEKGILCKLDIQKASNKLNWKFLLTVLKEMGFGSWWIGLIQWCISTASFSIIINGIPTGFFKAQGVYNKEIRYPPIFFVLGIEVYSILIDKATRGGYLASYNFRNIFGDVANISHLLFADDSLVFYKDSKDEMLYLSWILLYFEALSGLRINLDKSVILIVGIVENFNQLSCELGCRIGSLPSSYLGLPLGFKLNYSRVWEGIDEGFRIRLVAWKRQFISKGERLTLIKSTLSNIPIYLLSLCRMPKSVKNILEKI